MQRGENLEGMYLTYLLSSNKLSLAEIYITITELLLGGVDTVSVGVTGAGSAQTMSMLYIRNKTFGGMLFCTGGEN